MLKEDIPVIQVILLDGRFRKQIEYVRPGSTQACYRDLAKCQLLRDRDDFSSAGGGVNVVERFLAFPFRLDDREGLCGEGGIDPACGMEIMAT